MMELTGRKYQMEYSWKVILLPILKRKLDFSINANYTNYWTLGNSQPIYITAFIKSKDGNNLYRILDINVNISSSNATVTNVNKTITVTNDISHGKVQPHSLTVIMWKRTA
jgi:hypothetical protein